MEHDASSNENDAKRDHWTLYVVWTIGVLFLIGAHGYLALAFYLGGAES